MNEDQPRRPTWFGRNWKWLVPVVCVVCLALAVSLAVAVVHQVFGMIRSSDAYEQAVVLAREHAAVQEAVGTPMEEGFFTTGSISVNGPSGRANLAIPVSGPKGKATIYVVAGKNAGLWEFSTLVVQIKATKERIDLLE